MDNATCRIAEACIEFLIGVRAAPLPGPWWHTFVLYGALLLVRLAMIEHEDDSGG